MEGGQDCGVPDCVGLRLGGDPPKPPQRAGTQASSSLCVCAPFFFVSAPNKKLSGDIDCLRNGMAEDYETPCPSAADPDDVWQEEEILWATGQEGAPAGNSGAAYLTADKVGSVQNTGCLPVQCFNTTSFCFLSKHPWKHDPCFQCKRKSSARKRAGVPQKQRTENVLQCGVTSTNTGLHDNVCVEGEECTPEVPRHKRRLDSTVRCALHYRPGRSNH